MFEFLLSHLIRYPIQYCLPSSVLFSLLIHYVVMSKNSFWFNLNLWKLLKLELNLISAMYLGPWLHACPNVRLGFKIACIFRFCICGQFRVGVPNSAQKIGKTWFQLILPVRNHNVTKKSNGSQDARRGTQIYQMNRQINSFQNMCDMLKAKIDHLARKIDSLQKTPQNC